MILLTFYLTFLWLWPFLNFDGLFFDCKNCIDFDWLVIAIQAESVGGGERGIFNYSCSGLWRLACFGAGSAPAWGHSWSATLFALLCATGCFLWETLALVILSGDRWFLSDYHDVLMFCLCSSGFFGCAIGKSFVVVGGVGDYVVFVLGAGWLRVVLAGAEQTVDCWLLHCLLINWLIVCEWRSEFLYFNYFSNWFNWII